MEGLLVKLLRNGVAGNMFTWIKSGSYPFNHRAMVSKDSKTNSKKFLLRHGVPQGGVLSLTLFLLFINNLVAELPKGVKAALYADDLVLWCKEEHASTATCRLQQAANWPTCSKAGQKNGASASTKKSPPQVLHPVSKAESRHHQTWQHPPEGR